MEGRAAAGSPIPSPNQLPGAAPRGVAAAACHRAAGPGSSRLQKSPVNRGLEVTVTVRGGDRTWPCRMGRGERAPAGPDVPSGPAWEGGEGSRGRAVAEGAGGVVLGSGMENVGQLSFLFVEEGKRKPTDLRILACWLKEAISWPQGRDL